MRNRISSISALWLLILPALLILPGISGFPYPSVDAPFSDISVTHYPNALFLKRALQTWQTIPLWSPTILSGYPFFANPLSGVWYFPGWLALIFPLPLGFNLSVIAHQLWGGLGLYLFLRSRRLNHYSALFGALSFEALPKIFAHFGAGHLTLLYAIPWTPWLLLAISRSRSKTPSQWFYHPSVILTIIFFADVRWAAYAGVLWIAWEIAHSQKNIVQSLYLPIRGVALAAFMAAPLALPLLEYSRLSTRANLNTEEVLAFSLPPARLLGFLFPDFNGPHEWMLYLGGVVLSLTLLAIVWPRARNRSSFWVWVFGLSILYSMGEQFYLLRVLARFPGFSMLRVPSRALFLTGLAAVILAAFALNNLLTGVRQSEARRGRLILASVVMLSGAIGFAVWIAVGQVPLNILWGAGMLAATTIWIIFYLGGRIPKKIWLLGIFSISILDLGVMDASLFSLRPTSEVLSEGKDVAEYLSEKPGKFRVYSPSYSIPQQTAALYGLELADGVDPLQLQDYAEFMESATGIPRQGYSVTLPPFGDGDIELAIANKQYIPNTDLALLNVHYIVAEFDLEINYIEIAKFGNTRVYEISNSSDYVYILGSDNEPVQLLSWTPNRIELYADGPGILILLEIPYPGWQVLINEKNVEVSTVNDVNRSITLPEGRNRVTFIFRPFSLYFGMGISLLAIVALIVISRRQREIATIE